MSKFNLTNTNKTTNKCGYAAYKMDMKTDLVTKVLTTMFNEKKFYGDNSKELVSLAEHTDMDFVSRLAVFARKEMHLRSVSHVLTAIVARHGGGEFTRRAVAGVVERPDDILEIMSAYKSMYGKPFPNALKRQIAIEMNGFSEYAFAKYNGGNKEIKFKDVLCITHAKPLTASNEAWFGKILNDSLPVPYTWETELSANGNNKETWEKLIDSGKVGYMALLRNLRNIIKANPSNIDKVYKTLADPERVHKSKQLPFRYQSALKTLSNDGLASTKVVNVLEDAIAASCDNIEKIPGKTLIAVDVSGSMNCNLSANTTVRCAEVASLLGSIATHICEDAEVVTFDDSLKKITLSSRNGILANAEKMKYCGGDTDMYLPFQYILDWNKTFDRVIIISDNMCNCAFRTGTYYWGKPVEPFVDKCRKINPGMWVHAIDLMGYGTQQFDGKYTNIIAGWNERVFEFIMMAEKGFGSIVKTIEKYN